MASGHRTGGQYRCCTLENFSSMCLLLCPSLHFPAQCKRTSCRSPSRASVCALGSCTCCSSGPRLNCLANPSPFTNPSPGFTSSVKPSLTFSPLLPTHDNGSTLLPQHFCADVCVSVGLFSIRQWVVGLCPPPWKVAEHGGKPWGERVLWKEPPSVKSCLWHLRLVLSPQANYRTSPHPIYKMGLSMVTLLYGSYKETNDQI